jgi:hypothetical protein
MHHPQEGAALHLLGAICVMQTTYLLMPIVEVPLRSGVSSLLELSRAITGALECSQQTSIPVRQLCMMNITWACNWDPVNSGALQNAAGQEGEPALFRPMDEGPARCRLTLQLGGNGGTAQVVSNARSCEMYTPFPSGADAYAGTASATASSSGCHVIDIGVQVGARAEDCDIAPPAWPPAQLIDDSCHAAGHTPHHPQHVRPAAP